MMNPNMPPSGGANPQAQEFLMSLLKALFGGGLGQPQGGGMPPSSPPPSMGWMGGMGGDVTPSQLPKVGVDDPVMKMPSGQPPTQAPGQGPFQRFDRGLPKTRY